MGIPEAVYEFFVQPSYMDVNLVMVDNFASLLP